MDPLRCAQYIASSEKEAQGLPLYIEGPVDAGNKPDQIRLLTAITKELTRLGSGVKIVYDEWCNTYRILLISLMPPVATWCKSKPRIWAVFTTSSMRASLLQQPQHGEAYQGGTCNETDVSARTCVHVALCRSPYAYAGKSQGMGFDEGLDIVFNEMNRTIALLQAKD